MTPAERDRQLDFRETLLSARRTMVLSEILKLAADSFRANKVRFALTALGMVFGTASVILVVTISLTGRRFILAESQKGETTAVELEYAGGGSTASERTLYDDYLTREDERPYWRRCPVCNTPRRSSPCTRASI
jgi:putative ABC transport system permease protein